MTEPTTKVRRFYCPDGVIEGESPAYVAYVLHQDYEALEAKLAALEAERDELARKLADSEYKHSAEYLNKLHGPGGMPTSRRGTSSYYDDDRA